MSELLHRKLQQCNLGMIWLDRDNRVQAFNDVARNLLAPAAEKTFGMRAEQLHGIDLFKLSPISTQQKLGDLLRDGQACPARSPVTMMINIPDRVLLIHASTMFGPHGVRGTCLVFHDLTDVTMMPSDAASAELRQLKKIPIYRANRLMLIDLLDTIWLEASDHYTWIHTGEGRYLSNLSLSDLEARMDARILFRCHRSHMVNLRYITEIRRSGDSYHLSLKNLGDAQVPVSRKRIAALKEQLGVQ